MARNEFDGNFHRNQMEVADVCVIVFIECQHALTQHCWFWAPERTNGDPPHYFSAQFNFLAAVFQLSMQLCYFTAIRD